MECGVDAADLSRPAFPQHQQSGDCYSTLTDRPDERLNVRFGSIATEARCPRDVRFSPDSDHFADALTLCKSAKSFRRGAAIFLADGSLRE